MKLFKASIPAAQRALGIVKPPSPAEKPGFVQRLREIAEELATLDVSLLDLREMKELFDQLHVSARVFAGFGQVRGRGVRA